MSISSELHSDLNQIDNSKFYYGYIKPNMELIVFKARNILEAHLAVNTIKNDGRKKHVFEPIKATNHQEAIAIFTELSIKLGLIFQHIEIKKIKFL